MKRHRALVPLSHDHHHGLVQARRLRQAAEEADPARHLRVGAEFVAYFSHEGAAHFRDEEEFLLPLLADRGDPSHSLLLTIAEEHATVRALARQIRRSVNLGTIDSSVLGRLGTLLEGHIRLEERSLFPLIEELATAEDLDGLSFLERTLEPVAEGSPIVNLTAGRGSGPLWGVAGEDLNATLLAWEAGESTPEQTNHERDILLVGIEGTAEVCLAAVSHPFGEGRAVLIEKGTPFSISPGATGVRYLSVHLRRPGLQIASTADTIAGGRPDSSRDP
ncbi:MAG TPA: hemerythrin domain-containing protein [Gaiellaceae bacterium]|jgi:hemerythrin-like domain-containing protein